MQFLVTGHKSGLGKFLLEEFGGDKYDPRYAEQPNLVGPKTIIHCGYQYPSVTDASKALSQMELAMESLSRAMSLIGTAKLVLLSSVDVYPYSPNSSYDESSCIDLRDIQGVHGFLKLALEHHVMRNFKNFLILRPALMLGNHIRENSVTRILTSETCDLSIGPNSTFNLITHQSVADFLRVACELDLTGVYNLASSTNLSLASIASLAGRQNVKFGEGLYRTSQVDNSKVSSHCKDFRKTSEEVLLSYMESLR